MKQAVKKTGAHWYPGVITFGLAARASWQRQQQRSESEMGQRDATSLGGYGSQQPAGFAGWQNPANPFQGPGKAVWAGGGVVGMGMITYATYAIWLAALSGPPANLVVGVVVGAQIGGFLAAMIAQNASKRHVPGRGLLPGFPPAPMLAVQAIDVRRGHPRRTLRPHTQTAF